jgi:polysaccharide export outer membrane protein
LLIATASCTSYKKVPYLQTGNQADVDLRTFYKENTVRFQPDDILSIMVNVMGEPSVAYDFNLPLQPAATPENSDGFVNQGIGRQTYMVNKEGEIDFPILGAIKVSGYTQAELEQYLKKTLRTWLKEDPVITVRLTNFKISVIGEVNRPGQYGVGRDRINILEALALAGEMSIAGKRDDVQVIREMPNGDLKRVVLDISKAEIVSSPYFYLQQNDIVYVVPNKTRARSADIGAQTSIIFSVIGVLFSIANIIISLNNR